MNVRDLWALLAILLLILAGLVWLLTVALSVA